MITGAVVSGRDVPVKVTVVPLPLTPAAEARNSSNTFPLVLKSVTAVAASNPPSSPARVTLMASGLSAVPSVLGSMDESSSKRNVSSLGETFSSSKPLTGRIVLLLSISSDALGWIATSSGPASNWRASSDCD